MTKEQYTAQKAPETKVIPLADIGFPDMTVRAWDGPEQAAYYDTTYARGGRRKVPCVEAVAIRMSAVDESGALLFTSDDDGAIARNGARFLNRCAAYIRDLNGIGEEYEIERKNGSAAI